MRIVQVIFEKGVSLHLARRLFSEKWVLDLARGEKSVSDLSKVKQAYDVRPVVARERMSQGSERTWLFTTSGELVGECYYDLFNQIRFDYDASLFRFKRNLNYILGASIYHCKRLAEMYEQVSQTFTITPEEVRSSGQMHFVTIGSQIDTIEIYYEFEALITALRRAYDATRYILWHTFGPSKGSVPSSFAKTFPLCEKLPSKLQERLSTSWSRFGEHLTDYRDCVQHYVHLSPPTPLAEMQQLEEGVWSVSFWIPDNPEVRSAQRFQFRSKTDALTYGWELVNEILEVAREIVKETLRASKPDVSAA